PRKDTASSTSTAAVLGKRKAPRKVGFGRGMTYLREADFLASSVETSPLILRRRALVTTTGGKRGKAAAFAHSCVLFTGWLKCRRERAPPDSHRRDLLCTKRQAPAPPMRGRGQSE